MLLAELLDEYEPEVSTNQLAQHPLLEEALSNRGDRTPAAWILRMVDDFAAVKRVEYLARWAAREALENDDSLQEYM